MSHIYTLPEEFIHDSSVPIHWKLYALINGFWINSLPVYASSRHFAVKLKCSDRHIRGSLERLEKMGLIDRQIDGHKRLILPGTRKSQFLVPGTPSSADPELPVPPNAFSISTNKTSEADASHLYKVVEEGRKPTQVAHSNVVQGFTIEVEGTKQPRTSDSSLKKYNELCDWLSSLTGAPMPNRVKQYRHLKDAKAANITIPQIKERAEELWSQKFYQENGMDWGAVVNSFNRKG